MAQILASERRYPLTHTKHFSGVELSAATCLGGLVDLAALPSNLVSRILFGRKRPLHRDEVGLRAFLVDPQNAHSLVGKQASGASWSHARAVERHRARRVRDEADASS